MGLCRTGAQLFSTCSKRRYFSIILDKHGYVLSTGYNGVPSGMKHCADGGCPRALSDSNPGEKYDNCLSNHAEQNALLRADRNVIGGSIYINGPPCFTCAKLIVGAKLATLVYVPDSSYEQWPMIEQFFIDNKVELVSL